MAPNGKRKMGWGVDRRKEEDQKEGRKAKLWFKSTKYLSRNLNSGI